MREKKWKGEEKKRKILSRRLKEFENFGNENRALPRIVQMIVFFDKFLIFPTEKKFVKKLKNHQWFKRVKIDNIVMFCVVIDESK